MGETRRYGEWTYQLIRSDRRSIAVQITSDGLVVRAPRQTTQAQIDEFLSSHDRWLRTHMAKAEAAASGEPPLTAEELQALADEALRVIPERVRYYAPLVGVTYGRITIRNQRSKWGSCSGKGNLNFNCLLMLAPPEVLDSVVVHELCHRRHPNHGPDFYAEVLRVYPNYRACEKWLKDNGLALMRRNPIY